MELNKIQLRLQNALKEHTPPLQVRKENENVFEVAGTKRRMQGKQMVDGFYFASVVPKPKDIRLYFFPLYTHPTQFVEMSETLKKFLKGKTCFHIKKLDEALEAEIKEMIKNGIDAYVADDLI